MRYGRLAALTIGVALAACFALQQPQSATVSAQNPSQVQLQKPRQKSSTEMARWLAQEEQPEWAPEEPYDLSGPMPKDEDVAAAIKQGIDFLLERQFPDDGAWDDRLTGTMLSFVADHALDSVALTSLCGMALRANYNSNPERIGPALDKAVGYILSQVFRGKLPLRVFYANWRYTTALQFLCGEYPNCKDENRKAEMEVAARRIVNALLKMQLSNSEATLLERAAAARISDRAAKFKLPGNLGVILALPTDGDYRGGALVKNVIENGGAAAMGLQAGDRITECEGLRIENALDYYMMEINFMRGQKVSLKYKRDGKVNSASVEIPLAWAAYFGMEVGGDKGPPTQVTQFLGLSPAEKAGLKVGDVITAIDGNAIKTANEYYQALYTTKIGAKVKFTINRAGKTGTIEVEAALAPEGDLGIFTAEEDVSPEEGIPVGGSMVRPQPGPVVPGPGGAALGMKPGDRVCAVNGIPVFSQDQFPGVCAACPAGLPVLVDWIQASSGERRQGVVIARAHKQPGSLGVVLDVSGPTDPPKIKSMVKDSVAELGGLKAGDIIMSINGINVPTHIFFKRVMSKFYAGEVVDVVIMRGQKLMKGKFLLDKADRAFSDVEEGGWAYYPDMGESTSFGTAAALLALYDAAKVFNLQAPQGAIKAAENLVFTLRSPDPNHAGIETYHYRRSMQTKDLGGIASDVRGCLGRNPICELCMVRAGKRTKKDLEKTLATWVEYRGELDRVKNFPFTHFQPLWQNAAYYWIFGHMYAVKAARDCGGKTFEKVNEIVIKALMRKRESDGTWQHHISFGKQCGTAMALMAFGDAQGSWKK